MGPSETSGTIANEIKEKKYTNDSVKLSVAEGKTIKLEGSLKEYFKDCEKLVSAKLNGFDTSEVTDMSSMFEYCESLTELDLSSFDTSKVTDMNHMFRDCKALPTLDVTAFDTSNVTDMNYMFSACRKLGEELEDGKLDLSGFNTSSVTDMSHMFFDCSKIKKLDLSGFDTSSVTDMSQMFNYCENLTELDLSSFNTSKVTNMSCMFSYCTALTTLDVSGFNTSKVTNMHNMFELCKGLTTLDVSGFDTSEVTDMSSMFKSCELLTTLNLSGFNTSKVTNMEKMFNGCDKLETITVSSSFITTGVTKSDQMFSLCNKLKGGAGTPYDYKIIDATYARIDGGTDNKGYFTGTIGEKVRPDAVGDIVFKDGSATAYTSGMTLTDDQKSAAIAVIFYKGSSSDSLGAKTLGIGLKKSVNAKAWAAEDTKGVTQNFTAIQCTDSTTEPATGVSYGTYSVFVGSQYVNHYVTGDLDGSDNWSAIQSQESKGSTTANAPTNYPAWDWVNNYASVDGSNVAGTKYATGWYMPTAREILESNLGSDTVRENVGTILSAVGGDNFAITGFWTSSQDSENDNQAYYYNIGHNGGMTSKEKTSQYTVRAIRQF